MVVFITILGVILYLAVGIVAICVAAAVEGPDKDGDINAVWWFALPFWPVLLPVGLVCFALGPLNRGTLRLIRRLNPEATGKWY